MLKITDVLQKPIVTEKTVAMTGKYTFSVHPKATKEEVLAAVKTFYGVTPKKVNISRLPAKGRLVGRGRMAQKRAVTKKAVVTLAAGESLDFNAFK